MTLRAALRGIDRTLRFILGATTAFIVGVFFAHIPPHMPWRSISVALAGAAIIGFIQELHYSSMRGRPFCIWDWLWTFYGGIAVCWAPGFGAYLLALDG